MKFAVVVLVIATIVAINAQVAPASLIGGPSSDYFNSILNVRAQKLLNSPNFPTDLQERVEKTMKDAQAGFDQCNSNLYLLPWMKRVCISMQFSNSQNRLKAIEDEWNARLAASTAPAASTTSAASTTPAASTTSAASASPAATA